MRVFLPLVLLMGVSGCSALDFDAKFERLRANIQTFANRTKEAVESTGEKVYAVVEANAGLIDAVGTTVTGMKQPVGGYNWSELALAGLGALGIGGAGVALTGKKKPGDPPPAAPAGVPA